MTVAEYAGHRPCSRRAVYDALRAGRIARLPGGRIDSKVADRAWKVNTLGHVGGKPQPKGAVKVVGADRRRVRVRVSDRAVATGEAEARRLLGAEVGTVLSFADARRASSVVAALAALTPRLVRLAHHDYSDRLLAPPRIGCYGTRLRRCCSPHRSSSSSFSRSCSAPTRWWAAVRATASSWPRVSSSTPGARAPSCSACAARSRPTTS